MEVIARRPICAASGLLIGRKRSRPCSRSGVIVTSGETANSMIAKRLFKFLSRAKKGASAQALQDGERWVFSEAPGTIYAIGDVHGRLDLLRALESQIAEDASGREGETWVILLGDIVDRGPSSAQVIDHLIAPPSEGLRRFCLRGNHEALMLDFLRRPRAKVRVVGARRSRDLAVLRSS